MDKALKRCLMPKNQLAIIQKGCDGQKEYCCVHCPLKFSEVEKLEIHLCLHYKEYRFLCGICGTGLKRKEHLDRHTLGHQEVRPHVCPECGKAFKRKEHLNIHRTIHTGSKSEVCTLCNRSFYRKDHLQKHLQTHNKLFIEQNIFPMSDQELMDIKQEVEDIKPEMTDDGFNCEVMMEIGDEQDVTIGPSGLKIAPLPPSVERPHACEVCYKTFKRRDHLKLHAMTHVEKDKVCTECGKAFHREEQLLSHMRLHLKALGVDTGDVPVGSLLERGIEILPLETSDLLVPREMPDSRPHECPVCHRKFKRKQHLKVHANVHVKLQQPTIWCSLCNAGFQNNVQFEKHRCMTQPDGDPSGAARVHAPDAENDYPTEFVDVREDENVTFPSYAEEQPIMIVNDEQNIPTPQRVYVCKYCSKPFKRKDHYKIHLHIHTGVKSFFCPDCGKGFYRKDHLQKHGLVHQRMPKPKAKKEMPDLFPIRVAPKKMEQERNIKPEITITAPSNTKLRVPLQIKVPYQMVMAMDNGEQRAVNIDPDGDKVYEII